ncbi:putative bifunctional diguanylate cyclase/phosphodiesterase [Actinocatenispora rupis]|uniref:putative bifunctional diguanylate cyclase/phosphodiesterase n=1 Tax=Actinocatenispora rupis TaxID=519421 RepID=UPI001940F75B|nr:bifunctional diguanylate cyclase/phosphodiesterase [Actinocatenispora rupis]
MSTSSTEVPNRRLSRYISGYGAVALSVLLIATAKLPGPSHLAWQAAGLVALYAVAGLANLEIRIRSQGIQFAWGEAALIIGLVMLPSSEVVWAAMIGRLIAELIERRAFSKLVLNVGKQIVAVSAAAVVCYFVAGSRVDPFTLRGALALVAAAVVYALVANISVGIAVRLASGAKVPLLPMHRVELIAICGNIGTAFVALAMLRFDPRLLLALPPLLLSVRLISTNRLRTRTERATWQRIAAATDRFSNVDLESVLSTAVTSAAELFSADQVEVLVRLGDEPAGIVRGDQQGVDWAGQADEAPDAAPGETIAIPLGGQRDHDEGPGELRLRFRGRVRLTERERYALRTFAAALGTALRNAYAYAEAQHRAARHAHDAAHDPLTGLANRRYLLRQGEEILRQRPVRGTHAMVLIDLDHFKEVNDTLGHSAGDEVLTAIGRRLATAAGPDDIVVRLGGDEFAVLFVALAAPALAVHRARQMLATLDPPIEVDGIRITVGGSAGVALAPVQGGVGELLRRADVAMYQAKREGVRLAQYARTRDTADVTRLALGGDLRSALADDQFAVRFQPIVDLNSGQVTAAEALARWHHPYRGDLNPHHFLTAIERSDLLPEFTEVVLDAALDAAQDWAGAGYPIGVSVNVSPRSLLDPGFPDLVSRRLARVDVPPERLTLELTETLNLSRLDVVDEILLALRELGVRIALDDFGTGTSSLAMLARVPVDELKIDRSFVAGLTTSPESAAVVRSAIDLGRGLNLAVVAEGVESQQQRALLFELGCPTGQGHLFSRAVSAEKVRDVLGAGGALAPSMSSDAQVIRIPAARLVRGNRHRL